ncbi:hypothetical protein HGA91_00095 [candidate division WWE3 bacterium]|nr:hypothetical protein [candidate division WWE3 bacterium]
MGNTHILGHVHIVQTDRHATVTAEEVFFAAHLAGFSAVHITPHYRDPNHPEAHPTDRLLWEVDRQEQLRHIAQRFGVKVHIGVELDILPVFDQGSNGVTGFVLDGPLPDTTLSPVIVACHFTAVLWHKKSDGEQSPAQRTEQMMVAYQQVLESPGIRINVIGHPFRHGGDVSPSQLFQLAQIAAMHDVAIELNVNQILEGDNRLLAPATLDALRMSGVAIYIGTDIHTRENLHFCDAAMGIKDLLLRTIPRGQIIN